MAGHHTASLAHSSTGPPPFWGQAGLGQLEEGEGTRGEARDRGTSQESAAAQPERLHGRDSDLFLFSPFPCALQTKAVWRQASGVPSSCQEQLSHGRSPGVARDTRTGRDRGGLLLGIQIAFAKQETLNKALGLPL